MSWTADLEQLLNHGFSFSVTPEKWLGSFRSADDSSFPQPVKPFVLPRSSPSPLSHPPSLFPFLSASPPLVQWLLLSFSSTTPLPHPWFPFAISYLLSSRTCLITPVTFFLCPHPSLHPSLVSSITRPHLWGPFSRSLFIFFFLLGFYKPRFLKFLCQSD